MNQLFLTFISPPNEFTQIPWWFWNDEITEEGIREQLADFRSQGVYGFTIHARMGLSHTIPYLGARWFELVRSAVEEAERHDMIVHLYDEGMYPSGSAHGQVVEGHPEFLARGLEMRRLEPSETCKLGAEERCIAIQLEGESEATAVTEAAQQPKGKAYRAFVMTPSGGTIRGVHEGEDDRESNAPSAADLLNPAAVRRFIECTHDRYYQELEQHFGGTIRAIFTDEPSIMGRGAKRGLKPWTEGLEAQFHQRMGYDLIPLLSGLWEETDSRASQVRRDYADVVAQRLNESYYHQLSDWCAKHRIALTGHPAASDDIGPLRYFQLPGQDMVWRYVEPDNPSALEGAHSTVAKCSSSAARHLSARRNGNELYGAYGWKLTFDEMKWLADWMMVRGVNLLWPHAFYYSMRDFRAHERPPDVGRNNLWWKHYHLLANYTSRLCWLLTDSEQVCEIAILAQHNHLPWEPAKVLFQHQWDFNYLEDRMLTEATIVNGRLQIGDGSYSTIVRMKDYPLTQTASQMLEQFAEAGGRIVDFNPTKSEADFLSQLHSSPDVVLEPASRDLRYVHLKKSGWEFYYLTNEGAHSIEGRLNVCCVGHAEWWDPLSGQANPAMLLSQSQTRMCVSLTNLDRREGRVLAIDPRRRARVQPNWTSQQSVQVIDISTGWKLFDPEMNTILSEELIDWALLKRYETFSGTLIYERTIEITAQMLAAGPWVLDLNDVHDFAEVYCDGTNCGVCLWAPFHYTLPLKPGRSVLRVAVTNSMANRMENASLRSGMLGTVTIRQAIAPENT